MHPMPATAMSTVYLLAALAVLLYVWVQRRRQHFRHFEKRGIKGPKPNLFYGNAFDIYYRSAPVCYREWQKRYGDVFGYFNGVVPLLVVCDKAILKQVQIKDFKSFMDRGLANGPSPRGRALTQLNGLEWKHARSTLTPSFTISRLRAVTESMSPIIDELMERFDKAATAGQSFDIYRLFQALTTDVICRIAMGINYRALNKPDHPIILRLRSIISVTYSLATVILLSFPQMFWLLPRARKLEELLINKGDLWKNPSTAIMEDCARVIRRRREDPKERRNDLLQLLLDARSQDTEVEKLTMDDDTDQREARKATPTPGAYKSDQGLSDDVILQNAWFVMIAGYETTSNTLASISHVLMKHPEIQNKMRQELRQNINDPKNIDFETLQKLPYMEAVIKEVLRMFTPVVQLTRQANKDTELPNGLNVKKDDLLVIPVDTIHHLPKYFKDPHTFRPERFIDEEVDPMTFQPFGNGPRNCIGMRFAQMEIKLTLAKLLLTYRLEPTAETRPEIIYETTVILQRPVDGVFTKLVRVLP